MAMHRLTDLREILRYVPRFRDRLFVIAIDGAVVEDENFRNVLLDLALLKSLRIGVVLVHGALHQILKLADLTKVEPSNLDGSGITDDATLQLALFASSRVAYELVEGLDAADLHGVTGSFLVAHPAGILGGVDHLWTGKIERVQTQFLQTLVAQNLVPVVSPVGADGEGRTYRLNSDHVAVEVAAALKATKLIFLSTLPGVTLNTKASQKASGTVKTAIDRQRETSIEGLLRSLSIEEAEAVLAGHRDDIAPELTSKLEQAVRAVNLGVPRVHMIDGRVSEGLLAEVFSNLGVGTMVHANEYQAIRKAAKKDARAILNLIAQGVANDELVRRSRAEIERTAEDFFVFEVDKLPVACAAVHYYPSEGKAELACVCVDPRFENRGIGRKMIEYGEAMARQAGMKEMFLLSTQAFNYFQQKGGFAPGAPANLPAVRREKYDKSGRRSLVLVKLLEPGSGSNHVAR